MFVYSGSGYSFSVCMLCVCVCVCVRVHANLIISLVPRFPDLFNVSCNIEKLGMGLGTRLPNNNIIMKTFCIAVISE